MELDVSKYRKIPFKEKGRTYEGVDCWGLGYLLYNEILGIAVPSYSEEYDNTEDSDELAALINNEKTYWEKIKHDPSLKPYDLKVIKKLKPLDVVIIRLKNEPMHCGFYVGEGKFIQCLEEVGVTVEKLDSIMWRNRIVEYRRHRKLC